MRPPQVDPAQFGPTMNMMHAIAVIAALSHVFVSPSGGTERKNLGRGEYEISCEGDALTVRANDANVVQLLTEFSRKSGITFNKYVGKTLTATLDLNDVTVEEFLNRVLGSYVATSKNKNGVMQISSVTIMDEGEESSPPRHESPPPKGPAAAGEEPQAVKADHPPGEREVQWRRLERARRSSRRRAPSASPSQESPPPESAPPDPEAPVLTPPPPASEEPEEPPPDSVLPPPPGP